MENYRAMVVGYDLMQLKQILTLMLPYIHALNIKSKGELGMTSAFMILQETIKTLEGDLQLISGIKSLMEFFELVPKYNAVLKENNILKEKLEEQTQKINDFRKSLSSHYTNF